MNSIFEMLLTISRYNAGEVDALYASSGITSNLGALTDVEEAPLRNLAQSVGYSLADVEIIGEDAVLRQSCTALEKLLNERINQKTAVIEAPDLELEGIVGNYEDIEIRKGGQGEIFVCARDQNHKLSKFWKFGSLNDLQEEIWIASLSS